MWGPGLTCCPPARGSAGKCTATTAMTHTNGDVQGRGIARRLGRMQKGAPAASLTRKLRCMRVVLRCHLPRVDDDIS